MTPEQIKLVQESFDKVKPIAADAAKLFYAKLFELDPELKPLFKGDMVEQGNKLMTMLGTAVGGLNNIEALVPAVEELGKRHVGYGVEDSHYETVGAALLSTLETGLGDAFTPDVREAWATVYGVLSSTMINASKDVAA